MIGALLAAAVAVASPGAREVLAGLLAAKLNGPRICWEADDVDAIVLVSIGSDGATESIDGPRGPTISDTVELLDPASPKTRSRSRFIPRRKVRYAYLNA